ncbi:amino acid ABC transporter permease [Acidihalobacter ferrooxydans]|uniref:Amino acid ABC transporter permease n=1 Tax=Acidihalobacter ferrooxydans TaxID=1765967 RepID=A0A1P8UL80_9GAMM|nr:amino acid ABC transporter permease [Acidihalobacter ferrooxydans]APZ44562.1 amino acid ABC transporter permease [Acidihalobacter ferrooxydans]
MSNHQASATPWWLNQRIRGWIAQLLVIAFVAGFFTFVAYNTQVNMQARGISNSLSFFGQEAGFSVIQSLIPYSSSSTYGRVFLVGLLNTLFVSVIGIIFASLLGLVIGIARLSSNWLLARLAGAFIETFRNIPLLLQIFFFYFAVMQVLPTARQSFDLGGLFFFNNRGVYLPRPVPEPAFWAVVIAFVVAIGGVIWLRRWARRRQEETGQPFPVFWGGFGLIIGLPLIVFFLAGMPLGWSVPQLRGFNFQGGLVAIPEFTALLLALTIYTAASIAEIVRSGILSVSHGQTEAARSLGLPNQRVLQLVVLPQALRVIIPPVTSQYLNLTKNSSLATAIGYPDLVSVFAGTALNQTGQAVVIIGITMGVYLTISLSISLLMNVYNQRVRLVER